MKKIIPIMILILWLVGSTAKAEAAEITPEILDNYYYQHASETEAAVIAVSKGSEVFSRFYGTVDQENNAYVVEDSVFEWGSVSKLLVWTSVMQQVEAGRIDLNADVREYFPEAVQLLAQKVTMYDLMNHAGGFEDQLIGVFDDPDQEMQPLLQVLQENQPKQIYTPGEVTAYSNWGTALAAYVVECTAGVPYYEYVAQHIFQPMNMEKTALKPDLSDNEWVKEQRQLTQGYTNDGWLIKNNRRSLPLYPAGMATGTLNDLRRFVSGLMDLDSGLFQKAETYQELFSPTRYYDEAEHYPYIAHGFWAHYFQDGLYYGHGGNTAAHSAYVLLQPETRDYLIIMTNQKDEFVYTVDLPTALLGKFEPQNSEKFAAEPATYQLVSARNNLVSSFTPLMTILNRTTFTFEEQQLNVFGYETEPVAENIYWLDGLLYSKQTDQDGQTKVLTTYSEYIEIPKARTYLQLGLMVIWGSALLAMIVLPVVLVVRKFRRKAFDWRKLVTFLLLLLSNLSVALLLYQALQLVSKQWLIYTASGAVALAGMSLLLGGWIFFKDKKFTNVGYFLLPLIQIGMLLYFHLTPWF